MGGTKWGQYNGTKGKYECCKSVIVKHRWESTFSPLTCIASQWNKLPFKIFSPLGLTMSQKASISLLSAMSSWCCLHFIFSQLSAIPVSKWGFSLIPKIALKSVHEHCPLGHFEGGALVESSSFSLGSLSTCQVSKLTGLGRGCTRFSADLSWTSSMASQLLFGFLLNNGLALF